MPYNIMNLIKLVKLFFWKYLKITRPHNFKLSGKLYYNLNSNIKIDGNSVLDISGDLDVTSSTLELINSTFKSGKLVLNSSQIGLLKSDVNLSNNVHFKNTKLKLQESSIQADKELRFHHIQVDAVQSNLEFGNYFFYQNDGLEILKCNLFKAKLVVGNNTRLQCSLNLNCANMTIGNNSFINKGTKISGSNSINIGDYVMISYDCLIFDNNSHALNYNLRRQEIDNGFPNGTQINLVTKPKSLPITIGNDVWIGERSTVLKGVTMHSKSVAASNTIVTKNVDELMLVYGYPNKYKLIINE
jgi:acetyltransferase-like isoleucine patch superfamily enzyme